MTDTRLREWIRPAIEVLESMHNPRDMADTGLAGRAQSAVRAAWVELCAVYNELYPEREHLNPDAIERDWINR